MKFIIVVDSNTAQATGVALDFDGSGGTGVYFSPPSPLDPPECILFPGSMEEGCWHELRWPKVGLSLVSSIPETAKVVPTRFCPFTVYECAMRYAQLARQRRAAQLAQDQIKEILEHAIVDKVYHILIGQKSPQNIQEAIETLATQGCRVQIVLPPDQGPSTTPFATMQFVKPSVRPAGARRPYCHVVSTSWAPFTTISIPPVRRVEVSVHIPGKNTGKNVFRAIVDPAEVLELYREQYCTVKGLSEDGAPLDLCRRALTSFLSDLPGGNGEFAWIGPDWITVGYQMPAAEIDESTVEAHTRLKLHVSCDQDSNTGSKTQSQ